MENSTERFHITLEDAQEILKGSNRRWFATVMEHGSIEVEIYIPNQIDFQTTHERDELYIVIEGRGQFINGNDKHSFNQGDVLYVPAGRDHRFEDFTENFKTWVIFFGPKGGQKK